MPLSRIVKYKLPALFLSIIIAFVLFSCFACDKDDNSSDDNCDSAALVKYYGAEAVDGCGFVIEIEGTDYKDRDLPVDYQSDSLAIKVQYEVLETYSNCGFQIDAFKDVSISCYNL